MYYTKKKSWALIRSDKWQVWSQGIIFFAEELMRRNECGFQAAEFWIPKLSTAIWSLSEACYFKQEHGYDLLLVKEKPLLSKNVKVLDCQNCVQIQI